MVGRIESPPHAGFRRGNGPFIPLNLGHLVADGGDCPLGSMDSEASASDVLSLFVLFPLEGVVKESFHLKALQDG